jgi:glycosyltransferase involved in cell wall biosynthesis
MNRPLRVTHLTLGLDVGGQEKLLVEFARHADRRRIALHIVSLTTRGPLAADVEACGWPVTALAWPDGLRPGLVPRLALLFRRLRADVVHTHDDRPNIYGAPAARLAGVPVVVHTRHHQGTRLSRRQRLLVRLASACNDCFVCISHDSARRAVAQGIPRRRVRVVHNGIDLAQFAHAGPAPGGFALLVARLAAEKGIDTLLEAAALAARERPDFRLRIAGDGPCRAELERQAARLGLGEAVRFLGAVRDVPALLAGARLFVLPSLSEGVSLTLLEAMGRGLPVVATAVGGNPEVVADGETGLLVTPRDPPALARAVLDLWTRPESCARLGRAGRRRAEALFDVRRMVARYEALYLGGRMQDEGGPCGSALVLSR